MRSLLALVLLGTIVPSPSAGAPQTDAALERALEGLIDPGYDHRVLHEREADLVALGSNWSATLGDREVRFYPRLEPSEGPAPFVGLRVRDVGRAGARRTTEPVVPTADGLRARYARSEGVVERYDVRMEGLEQSFVFAERPEGGGDLEVRLSVTTALEGRATGDAEFPYAFHLGERAVVTLGRVVGIDAEGRRVAGSVELEGQDLVLGLPAAFVDEATYPLVLDPLIGAPVPLTAATLCVGDAELAWNATTSEYALVCTLPLGSGVGITLHRLSEDFVPVGAPLPVHWPFAGAVNSPSIGRLSLTARFLVAWWAFDPGGAFLPPSTHVYAATVQTSSGTVSSFLDLPASGEPGPPDVGGATWNGRGWVVYQVAGAAWWRRACRASPRPRRRCSRRRSTCRCREPRTRGSRRGPARSTATRSCGTTATRTGATGGSRS